MQMQYLQSPEEGTGSPGAGVSGGCELLRIGIISPASNTRPTFPSHGLSILHSALSLSVRAPPLLG